MLTKTICIVAIAAGLFTVGASAGIVIDYDADTFGSGDLGNPTGFVISDLDGDTVADDVTGWVKGNTDVTASLNIGASYTGPTMYGVIRATKLNATTVGFDDRDATPVNVRMQGPDEAINWLLYFKTDAPVTLDATSYIAFDEDGNEDSEAFSRFDEQDFSRWVAVGDDGKFYVSDTSIGSGNDTATLNGDELFGLNSETAVMWAEADFASDIDQDLGSLTFNKSTADLNAISLVGFGMYLGEEGLDASVDNRYWVNFNHFTVDAQPVPEPASLTLLALLAIGGLMMLRRRAA